MREGERERERDAGVCPTYPERERERERERKREKEREREGGMRESAGGCRSHAQMLLPDLNELDFHSLLSDAERKQACTP